MDQFFGSYGKVIVYIFVQTKDASQIQPKGDQQPNIDIEAVHVESTQPHNSGEGANLEAPKDSMPSSTTKQEAALLKDSVTKETPTDPSTESTGKKKTCTEIQHGKESLSSGDDSSEEYTDAKSEIGKDIGEEIAVPKKEVSVLILRGSMCVPVTCTMQVYNALVQDTQ